MFYLSRTTNKRLSDLKKNGVDAILLLSKMSVNGTIKDITIGSFAKKNNWSYPMAANGISYAQAAGLIEWQGDDLYLTFSKDQFQQGKQGFVKLHDVFASDKFIKGVSLVPKQFAIKLLCMGMGYCNHRHAKIGYDFKMKTLMKWIGSDRPHEVQKTLHQLKPFFVITYNVKTNLYNIKVKTKYLTKEPQNYKFSYKDLYAHLKEFGYFVKDKYEKLDLLSLLKKYGAVSFRKALEDAKYSWNNHKSHARYINDLLTGIVYN